MNTAERIYQEALYLPEAEAQEALDFVAFLRTRDPSRSIGQQDSQAVISRRKTELLESFSRFRIDMSNFAFDREEANARR